MDPVARDHGEGHHQFWADTNPGVGLAGFNPGIPGGQVFSRVQRQAYSQGFATEDA